MADCTLARRRFQFRLRTLMIGVTLLAILCGTWKYVSDQAELIRQRDAILGVKRLRDYGGAGLIAVLTDAQAKKRQMLPPYRMEDSWRPHFRLLAITDGTAEPNGIKGWFGMKMVRIMAFGRGTPSSEINRVMDLFPEATVYQYESGAPSQAAVNGVDESRKGEQN